MNLNALELDSISRAYLCASTIAAVQGNPDLGPAVTRHDTARSSALQVGDTNPGNELILDSAMGTRVLVVWEESAQSLATVRASAAF